VGQERVTAVNQMVDELIDYGHLEAATIAEWKDGVNDSWADLLELMETRAQMLAASHQLHKFFSDCREVRGNRTKHRYDMVLFFYRIGQYYLVQILHLINLCGVILCNTCTIHKPTNKGNYFQFLNRFFF